MRILIKNKISLASEKKVEEEKIEFLVEGALKEISEKKYLSYVGENGLKCVIKFDKKDMRLTQYGQPTTTMHFSEGKRTKTNYQGLGQLLIETQSYQLFSQEIRLKYTLLQAQRKIGDYQMEISYGN